MKTYLPAHFAGPAEAALAFMREYPFALLIVVDDGEPIVGHVPMRVDASGERLQFHLARANPQVEALARQGRATVVFHGPHAYVSPRHYAAPNVPTWNFAAVHVEGPVRTFDEAATAELVAAFSRDYEGPDGLGDFEQGSAYAALLRGITGFELTVATQRTKFKLSQNRSAADREGVIAALAADSRSEVRAIAQMMGAHPPKPA